MEETESRHAAFRDLLRDVGQQLSQTDISTVEFYENVPPQMKGQSGLMLLDALRKSGKFSPWKTQPLREILRSAGRCDLADDTVKRYQLQFEDKDSPMTYHRPLERGTSTPVTGSPRLLPSHVRPHTAASPKSPRWTPTHRRARSELSSLQNSATSETKHPLSEPREEVGPSSPSMPSLPQSVQPFPAPYPCEPPGTAECRGNGAYRHSNSVDKGSSISPSMPDTHLCVQSHTDVRASCPDVSSYPSPGNTSYYELGKRAIDAIENVVNVVASASSFSSLPSYEPSTSRTSLPSAPHTPCGGRVHKASLPQRQSLAHRGSLPSPEHKSATLPRNFSTPAWNTRTRSGTEPGLFHHLGEMDLDDMSGEREPRQASSVSPPNPESRGPAKTPEEPDTEPLPPPVETSTPKGSRDSLLDDPAKDHQRPTSAKARIKNFLKRPLSGQLTPPLSSYQWRVKREDLVRSVSRHTHAKLRSIPCPCQLELDTGHLKHSPKLSLKLYPYGLFEDEGKNVSLQVNIITHKKSPPISPSLQIEFTVTVLDDQGRDLRQRSTQQSLNMSVFYVPNLLSHDELIKGLQREYVELQIKYLFR